MRHTPVVVCLILSLVACGTAELYPRYTVVPSKDLLEGHTPADDIVLSKTCEPDPAPTPGQTTVPVLSKCVALKTPDFYAMEKELKELRQALKDCQAGPVPP